MGAWDSRAVYRGVLGPSCMFSQSRDPRKLYFQRTKIQLNIGPAAQKYINLQQLTYFESSLMSVDDPGC